MGLISAKNFSRSPRHWAIIGRATAGKSTFLTAMAERILVVDTEGRGRELQGINGADIFFPDIEDRQDTLAISRAIRDSAGDIRQAGIGLIAVDSISAIFKRGAAEAMASNARGLNKNRSSAFVDKSLDMRLIQDSIVSLGTDVAMIWHLETGRDNNAREKTSQSVSEVERGRLTRSLNAVVEIEHAHGKRIAKIRWARGNRSAIGLEFEDTEGFWRGVPDRIDAAVQKIGSVGTVLPCSA